jgi:guanylate kinase
VNSEQRTGLALVICAPSGAGKTTLIKRLRAEFPRFDFSVSWTTRAPREGERDGVDYRFVDKEEFLRRRDENFFAEWAEVHGNCYGTPLEETRRLLFGGKDIIFDIDVQGASQLRESMPGAHFIFILPPSRVELERRLVGRGTETPESTRKRLEAAGREIAEAYWFHTCIVNDDLETAWRQLRGAYLAATLSPSCQERFLDRLLKQWTPMR